MGATLLTLHKFSIPNSQCSLRTPHLLEGQQDEELGQDGFRAAVHGCRQQLHGETINA